MTTADTEAIAAQKPDVILVFAGDDNLETLKEIAPVIEITYGKSDYLKMLTDVGQIFGKEKEAQAWLDRWDKKVATAKEELKGLIDTSSTFTVMDFFDKNIFLYGNNFGRGGELVYRALGFAAPAKVQEDIISKEGWFGVSQEALPEYVGDYVLVNVNDKTKEAAASLKESDIWKNLPAVKNGHVIEVDYSLFYFSDPMSLDLQIDAFVSAIQNFSKRTGYMNKLVSSHYPKTKPKNIWLVFFIICLSFIAGGYLSLRFGAISYSHQQLIETLKHPLTDSSAQDVIIDLRLPRMVAAILVGAAMAQAGAMMQGITRNPIADPGLLGINAGAGLALIVAYALFGGLHYSQILLICLLGSYLAAGLVFGLAYQVQKATINYV